ncbi:MAG: 2-oxo acid dehydrogenase subunit E2 [Deltaproteobacteria bacterium]|nr:2-oxo acid dehydrogenase subunit E2 [Deltaproteobacteria bacterium]
MARVVEMPKLSPTMEEGQIVTWHKKEGDSVEVDELLAEVETDKATMEFRSFDRGTLLKVLAPAGSMVRLGDPVAVLGKTGESVEGLAVGGKAPAGSTSAPTAGSTSASPAGSTSASPAGSTSASPAAGLAAPRDPSERVKASPYVRKLARTRGIDLHQLAGSGTGGRIVARDLEGATLAAPAVTAPLASRPSAATAPSREPLVKPLSMMRRTIARRLTESKRDVPHFYLTIDVDAEALWDLRTRFNADVGRKLSFNDLVVKAVAVAIVRAPEVNAQFTPESLVFHRRIDISVAVAVEDGLVTPVVRDADTKTVLQISDEIQALSARARDKKLTAEEMTGGTFSISNLGMHGIDEFAAVINPPEGAILAVGAIRSEPVVRGDAVVPGRRMKMTLSCDHRVVDGAVGAKFLAELRKVLEHPLQILAH